MLYPTPSAPHPQPHPRDSRLLAPSSTSLRPSALQPFLAQNHPRRHSFSLQLQRHLQQQFSGSPVPDPRVTKLARSPSHWSNPNSIAHASQPQVASVPSLSPHRPPVPQFSSTHKIPTTNAYRRKMSTPNYQGTNSTLMTRTISSMSAYTSLDNDAELYGLPSAGLITSMGSPYSFGHLALGSDAGAFSPGAHDGTVSPQELLINGDSFPPSATFTDLSTPSFESPGGAFSSNPSPMFTDMDIIGEYPSLFHDAAGMEALLATVNEPVKQENSETAPALTPAPKRVSVPKPVSSPISATGASKPSTVAGISRPRKELSPIAFDPNDPVAAKRARNTEAARKSRAKKLERQMTAEAQIADLQRQLVERDELIASLKAQLETQRAFS